MSNSLATGDNSGNANADDGCKSKIEGLKPAAGVVLVQAVLAGLDIFYKLALSDGMNAMILVAYRYIFAAAFLCPLAYFLERERRPRLTWTVLLQAFGCGLFGYMIRFPLLDFYSLVIDQYFLDEDFEGS